MRPPASAAGRAHMLRQGGRAPRTAARIGLRDPLSTGEATVLGNTGLPDFDALRRELELG